MRHRLLVLLVVSLGAAPLVAGDVSNRWSSMSATTFTRCATDNDCLGEDPCSTETLAIGDSCFAECGDISGPGNPVPCYSQSQAVIGWTEASGFGGHYPCPGDVFVGTSGRAEGSRISATEFEIEGINDQTGSTEKIVEIALLRFAGDPAQFNGLALNSVSDLVDLGLIAESDVLFATEMTETGEILETVDVTGIPDEELVLFAAGEGPFPSETGCDDVVPALGVTGAVVLIGAFLVLGSLILRSGHSKRPSEC